MYLSLLFKILFLEHSRKIKKSQENTTKFPKILENARKLKKKTLNLLGIFVKFRTFPKFSQK